MPKKQTKSTKKPNIQSKETLTLVNDRFTRARNYRNTTQDPIWERSYKNWRGELDATQFPWRSKLFIPWSFTVVETIIPKVFAREPKWRVISHKPPELGGAEEDSTRAIQHLLTYQWVRLGMRTKMYDFIKDSLMYSKGYAKVSWNFKEKTRTYMEPVVGENDEITFEEKLKNEVVSDDPRVDIIDPMDIYVDPDAVPGEPLSYLVHRKTVPLATLKENPNYQNVDKIKAQDADIYLDKLSRYKESVPEKDQHKELIEVLEYWEDDRLVVIANRSVVLRDTPNPYWHKQIPFVELDDYRDPHKYYGQSELSVIDPLQREVNSIRNQRRDYDNNALNPPIMMIPGTMRNPNAAVMRPGAVWMVTDLNSIKPFEMPQLQGSAVQVEQQTNQDIQRSVAIDEIGIGLMPENAQRVAATTVVSSQSNAGKRFAMKIALLEEAVAKIGQLVFAVNQQFIDKERVIQIVGEDNAEGWVRMAPEDIQGDFHVEIVAGSMLPKDEIAARKEGMELLQYITPIISPIIPNNPEIIMPIVKMVLDTFDLPAKDDIVKELRNALGVATANKQAEQQAQQALSEAQALGATGQAVQAANQISSDQPSTDAPETLQGLRADRELERITEAAG